MRQKIAYLLIIALLTALSGFSSVSLAASYNWNQTTGGNWNIADNWDPNGVPNAADAFVTIDNKPSFNVNVTINNFHPSVGGLTIDSGDSVTVSDAHHLYLKNTPTVTNNGTINLTSTNSYLTAYNSVATLTGSGSVVLGGSLGNRLRQDYGGSFINDTLHTIKGGGTIEAAVTNKGTILATSAAAPLMITSTITNNGVLGAQGGIDRVLDLRSTITGGQIKPQDGTVELRGADLRGVTLTDGAVNVENHSDLLGVTSSAANITVKDGVHLFLKADGPTLPNLTNNGIVTLTGANSYLTAYNVEATLTGTGAVVLGGSAGNKLRQDYGGSLVNDTQHTIRGGGTIESITLTNKGKIIADHAATALKIAGSTINNEGLLQALDGSTLAIQNSSIYGGQIVPGNTVSLNDANLYGTSIGKGVVNVTGHSWLRANNTLGSETTVNVQDGMHLYLNNEILTNNGVINLKGNNSYLTMYNYTSTLTGTGQLVLGGKAGNRLREDYGGTLINDTNHTIRGGGTIDVTVNNKGKVIADNGTLQINRDITGDGSVRVASTGVLDLNANLTTGNFTMDNNTLLNVASNKYIDLKGNFLFSQTHGQENNWQWETNSYLSMTGLGAREQRLEVGGKEGGGFDNNFDLNKFSLSGANSYAFLTDWINNGNRSSDECLYVDDLYVGAGSTLNLNHLHLYVKGETGWILPTEQWKNGGGRIIDDYKPVPLPSTMLMLGSGLLGLVGIRRKFWKQ